MFGTQVGLNNRKIFYNSNKVVGFSDYIEMCLSNFKLGVNNIPKSRSSSTLVIGVSRSLEFKV